MTERPIIFSFPMVRAILDGSKTQTRRALKSWWQGVDVDNWPMYNSDEDGNWYRERCPNGQSGDRLWVRETFSHCADTGEVIYKADGWAVQGGIWAPAIHMRREYSRLDLEITDIRVERLQDISEGDAVAEGCPGQIDNLEFPSEQYRRLWDTLNAKRGLGWDTNPWVWVIEFKRVEAVDGAT